MRFAENKNPTVRFGAVFRTRKSYGAIPCGFLDIVNPTVRFGAVLKNMKSYGAVRCCGISHGAVRRGSPLNVFFYGAAPLAVGKTVQHRFFSTVHRMNNCLLYTSDAADE